MNTHTMSAKEAVSGHEVPTLTTHTTIAVIGLGYVGLPLAIAAAERGKNVIGFDISNDRVNDINDARVDFVTDDERESLARARNLRATTNENDLDEATAFIICVPTPVSDMNLPDLRPLEEACKTLARHLKKGDLVAVESTVNPGACESVVIPILEKSGLRVEHDFHLVHCPERINPGDSRWNVRTIPRVIGGTGTQSLAEGVALYESIIDAPLLSMPTLKEAEAVKMVENAFRDVNIAFVNELAMSFDKAGIDLISVIRGASTKPFGFMPHFPGAGVGGHCIPVDPYYLIRYGEDNGFVHHFLMTARRINNRMPLYTVGQLARALRRKRKQLAHSTVALLGLSYKKDIPDMRESPALEIREILEKRGVVVRTYDPHVPEHSTANSLDEALQDADAALIATDHSAFASLSPFHFMRTGVDVVVDGRNMLRKEDFAKSGVMYLGIGRSAV